MERKPANKFILSLLLPALLSGWLSLATAQNPPAKLDRTLRLSVTEAMQRVSEQNWEVRIKEQQAKMANADFRATKSLFLPSLEFSETLTSTNNPVNAFGFKLKQMQFRQEDFALDVLNDPDRLENFTTRIELHQPILNLDGLSGRKAAKDVSKAARFMANRTKYQMEWTVKQWYFRAGLAQERRKATHKAVEAAEENLNQAGDLLEAGMIKKADQMAARVRVLELRSELKAVENELENVYDRIRFLLNIDSDISIILTDSLEYFSITDRVFDANTEDRTDLLALESRIDAQKSNLKAQKAAFLPRLNAFASYELNDDDFLGGNADNYVVGARLSWSLFKGTENIHHVQRAKAELEHAELQYQEQISESRVELNRARRDLQLARDQLDILELAVEQAKETFRIRSDRYEAGMVSTTDLLSAEASLLSQRLKYLDALYGYHNAVFRIEFLTEQQIYQP